MLKRYIFAFTLVVVLISGGVLANGLVPKELSGTVRYLDLEGGLWVIESGGKSYMPIDLTQNYMVDGLKVRFKVVERPDIFGIGMRGSYVEIIEPLN